MLDGTIRIKIKFINIYVFFKWDFMTNGIAWPMGLYHRWDCMTVVTAWQLWLHDSCVCMTVVTAWQLWLHDRCDCMTVACQTWLHYSLECMTWNLKMSSDMPQQCKEGFVSQMTTCLTVEWDAIASKNIWWICIMNVTGTEKLLLSCGSTEFTF